MRRLLRRGSKIWVFAGLMGFVVLLGLAMISYTGGNVLDPSAEGFVLSRNYTCDLFGVRSVSGEPNGLARGLSISAAVALIVGLVPFWWLVGRSAPLAVGLLGMAATVCAPTVPLTANHPLHGAAVLFGGVPALAGVLLAVADQLRGWSRTRLAPTFGLCLVFSWVLMFAAWARLAWFDGTPDPLLPTAQRITTGLFLVWVGASLVQRGDLEPEVQEPRAG